MRSDFMGECNDPSLSKIINEHLVWLSAMTEDEFKEAIAKPAQLQRYEFGEGLLEAILADIEAEPNCLPLLEFALQELWTHRDRQSHKLTFSAYRHNLKGIKGALDCHAQKLYDIQSPERQQWIRRILLKLVRTGQDVKDTRQPAQRQTLLDLGKDLKEEKEIETVLRALEGNTGRLLVAYQENEVAIVDLAHEALIDGWQQFVEWRQVDREVRRLSNRINDDFKEWQRAQDKDKFKFLLPEGIVAQIEEVENAIKDYLTKEQQEFVNLSLFTYKPWLNSNFIIEMVEIPAGTFWMGSPERKGYSSGKPYHQVTMQSFHMGKYPVTQAQWRAVAMSPKVNLDDLSRNPSFHRGDDNRPVEQVSWHEAREFCDRLTSLAKQKGENRIYRLPTEAEWEYACRAGSDTEYFFGDDPSQLGDYAWYGNNSGKDAIDADAIWQEVNQDATQYAQKLRENSSMAQAVGQETKTPNAWGLYEMHGNVWEWCLDEWHDDYNSKPDSLKRNGNEAWGDINENDNRYHLLRGGSWDHDANYCRSAYRSRNDANYRGNHLGFRVVVVSFP